MVISLALQPISELVQTARSLSCAGGHDVEFEGWRGPVKGDCPHSIIGGDPLATCAAASVILIVKAVLEAHIGERKADEP